MTLNTATIVNYKNIAEARLEFSPKLNCLIGNNGQGKTNVLDAVYCLSMCRSFMTGAGDSALIKHGEDYLKPPYEYTEHETKVVSGFFGRFLAFFVRIFDFIRSLFKK